MTEGFVAQLTSETGGKKMESLVSAHDIKSQDSRIRVSLDFPD